jgi:amidohydrolase
MHKIVAGVAAACGVKAKLEIEPLTPAVTNDAQVTEVVHAAAEAVLGPENVTTGERTMGSEDAAYFMEKVPGCYFFLGSANASLGLNAPHHNPRFDFDEAALITGVAVMVHALAHYLA